MAWRCGSFSRTLLSTARASSSPFRSPPTLARPLRRLPLSSTRVPSRRFSVASPRSMAELGVGKTIQFLKGTVPCAQQSPILTVSSNKDMETDTAEEQCNTVPLPLNATKLNCLEEGAHYLCLMVLWWWGFFMGFAFNRGLQKGTRVAYTN